MSVSAPSLSGNRGVNPEWANLPRRRCDNCPKIYKPKQPLRKNPDGTMQHGFCSRACKDQFHKHGSAFIQLRHAMEKEFARMEKRLREIVREELNWVICHLPEGASLADWISAVPGPDEVIPPMRRIPARSDPAPPSNR
jgi:hypothetical protein